MPVAHKHIIFISGWGGVDDAWSPLLAEFENKNAGVVSHFFDWRVGLNSPEKLLQLIAGCDNMPYLCGWSLGGLLALQAAASGAAVAGLLLVASTARMCADGEAYPGADVRAIKAMRLKLRKKPDELLEDFSRLCFGDNFEQQRQQYLDAVLTINTDDLQEGLVALAGMDLRKEIMGITSPLHFFHAPDDRVIPYESVETIKKLAPGISLHTLNSGGHALPLTRPGDLATMLLDIL